MMYNFVNPYIIHVYEYFEDLERIYVVMEYCHGGSLHTFLNHKIKKFDKLTEC